MSASVHAAFRHERAFQAGRPLAVLVAAVLAGCSTAREPTAPYLEAAAAEARSAQEAYLGGRFGDAIVGLREAVRLHLAAGDLPGAARSQLNLALAERAAADHPGAAVAAARLRDLTRGAVQQVREGAGARSADAPTEAELEASSGWLGALLALDEGDVAQAQALAPPAGLELASSSQMRGRIETLRATIAVRSGRFGEAVKLADTGRIASEDAHDLSEVAHAWSLEGEGRAGMGDWPGARGDYLAAVALEERMGGGARMAEDLRQLAVVSEHLGDSGDAKLYSLRAEAIAAARDEHH